jgi:hypothetical protein
MLIFSKYNVNYCGTFKTLNSSLKFDNYKMYKGKNIN